MIGGTPFPTQTIPSTSGLAVPLSLTLTLALTSTIFFLPFVAVAPPDVPCAERDKDETER